MLMSGTSGGAAPTYTIQSGSHIVGTASLAPIWLAPLRVYPAAAALNQPFTVIKQFQSCVHQKIKDG